MSKWTVVYVRSAHLHQHTHTRVHACKLLLMSLLHMQECRSGSNNNGAVTGVFPLHHRRTNSVQLSWLRVFNGVLQPHLCHTTGTPVGAAHAARHQASYQSCFALFIWLPKLSHFNWNLWRLHDGDVRILLFDYTAWGVRKLNAVKNIST